MLILTGIALLLIAFGVSHQTDPLESRIQNSAQELVKIDNQLLRKRPVQLPNDVQSEIFSPQSWKITHSQPAHPLRGGQVTLLRRPDRMVLWLCDGFGTECKNRFLQPAILKTNPDNQW
jgi:hypothetical protein